MPVIIFWRWFSSIEADVDLVVLKLIWSWFSSTAGLDGSQEVPQEEREGKEEIKEEQEKEYSVEKEEKEEIDKYTEEVEVEYE